MKAIVKFFLIVLVLALCCSVFFGFSEAEDVEGDKSFIDNIKDGLGNIIDTIFPGDKGDDEAPDGNGNNDNVNQTHNSMHFSQGSAAKLRYITPKCEGHWQSINVLSGEHFLCYMLPDTYISFKNVGSESIFIGTAWKKGVFLEIPAGSETSNLDFSFSKDWWFWSASEYQPPDEELKANKTVISFTTEAGNELTIYDDYDNIYTGKGKTSLELELGREYTFTTTSKTLLLGSDFNSMVIAEIDKDDIFKFTPSTDKYAIWVKPESEKEKPALIYIQSGNGFLISDSDGNGLLNGDTTECFNITVENYDDGHVYYSPNGFGELGYTHVISGFGTVTLELAPDGVYYFWSEYDSEPEEASVYLFFSDRVLTNPGYSISMNGYTLKNEVSIIGTEMYIVVAEGMDTMYMSYDGFGFSSQEMFGAGSDTYITLIDGKTYYFWLEGETNFNGDIDSTECAYVYATEQAVNEGFEISVRDGNRYTGTTYMEIPGDSSAYLYGDVYSLFIDGVSFSNYSAGTFYFSPGETYYITSTFDDPTDFSLREGGDEQ